MRRLITLAIVFLAAAVLAHGDITTGLSPVYQPDVEPGSDPAVPAFNDGSYYVVDLFVSVSGDDDWTASSTLAELLGGRFFYHPLGDRTPSPAEIVAEHPALAYDTMILTTEPDGSSMPPFADPDGIIEDTFDMQDISVEMWFGIPPNGGDGDFMIARFTMKLACDQSWFAIEGAHTTNNHGGELFPYGFEPMYDPPPPSAGGRCQLRLLCGPVRSRAASGRVG